MPLDRLTDVLDGRVRELERRGTAKGAEAVVTAVEMPGGDRGPRVRLEGEGERAFIRLNSNSYLGMGLRPEVIAAEEAEARASGAGPGAVRFISGTYSAHVELERRLARFHGRDEAMLFSSAYAAVVGCLVPLIDSGTALISDELNHNSIINAVRLARPLSKVVYPHLDMRALDRAVAQAAGKARRAIVVTDGIFSMRGVHAPVDEIMEIARRHDHNFPENVVVVLDDSHGVGAIGATGRGTEEYTGSAPADLLVATLGKALGVNGGYVATNAGLVRYLRESAPFYIYSNPITPGEARAALKALEILDSEEGRQLLGRLRARYRRETAPFYIYSNPITPGEARAALKALEILDSGEGRQLLERLRALTRRFEDGLVRLGIEVLKGKHPVVPLMIPDIDYVLDVLANRPGAGDT